MLFFLYMTAHLLLRNNEGSRTNPQNKIISSSAKLKTSDWVMK